MPSPFPASFASAASGNAPQSEGGPNGRNTGSGDWSRSRANGATATFRRPSSINTSQRESGQSSTNAPPSAGSAYVPPHMNPNYQPNFARSGAGSETRYSKDQLLDLFKHHEKNGPLNGNISDLFMDGWTPGTTQGNENGGWGKKDEQKESANTYSCWDSEGSVRPISLYEMDDEEREIFSSSVNSSLKPATHNKDSMSRDGLNRRTSMSQQQTTIDSMSARSSGRRRDSNDPLRSGNPMSPSGTNRFSKDESGLASPPPSLLRRRTGNADAFGPSLDERDLDSGQTNADRTSPFGSLKRTSTQPASAGLNGPSSPWSTAPQSAGFAPMGAFGKFGAMDGSLSEKKPGFGSVRGQSRFKGLMGQGSTEESSKSKNALDSLTEPTNSNQQSTRWGPSRSAQTSKNLYEDDEDLPAGSAALGGDDASPPVAQPSRFRNIDQHNSFDDTGFASLGLGSGDISQFPQRRDFSHHHQQQQQTPQRNSALGQPQDSMSPTSTNPYQSPEGDRAIPMENDADDDIHPGQYNVTSGFGPGARNLQNQFESHDRSQTSSAKGFPNLGGLSNLSNLGGGGPWTTAPGAIGTPSRANAPPSAGFGDNFGPFGDLNSAGLNGSGFFGSGAPTNNNVGAVGGRSKLGALFPSTMQDQILGDSSRQDHTFGGESDAFTGNAPGFGHTPRDSETSRPMSKLDDMLSGESRGQLGHSPSFENDPNQPQHPASIQTPFTSTPSSAQYFARPPEPETPAASNQLPASQQRQMVMPDRMRWIYRDPQGNTQGPWSGLEMHDWYKAGFFSPELQVKKLEDSDYEPLAQLIRRIGNSREPFLVPQIGIAHGASGPQPNSSAAAPSATPSAGQGSSAQPPFAGSFPSFGTTLTAEQQNALERRKQEEQYLMARQKEHLVAQQSHMKQQMLQGGMFPQQLHHQSSGQSLHSQPSFGSITSPSGYQPSPSQVPIQPPSMPGFFEGMPRNAGPLGADALGPVREEDLPGFMERLQMGRGGPVPYGPGHGLDHQQQVNAMLQERARQQREQEQIEALQRSDDPRGTLERLEQYQQLRAQEEDKSLQQAGTIGVGRQPTHQQLQEQFQDQASQSFDKRAPEQLSLSEQVQKAAAKQQPAQAHHQAQPSWARVDSSMPQPLPPPQSSSPMPAPTPQRNRQSVADALNAESQSPSGTDSVETPSAVIAPWAKETNENSKGPSLKEIQAMEAKQAAQNEELQAAARRAVLEQERQNQKSQPVAPAPGLPSSANWASGVSPAVPVPPGASAWAKTSSGKSVAATPVSGAKKTLAQIQKEEEARKNRAAAAVAAATSNTANAGANLPPTAGGKRYADLASKTAPGQNPSNAAWTTVGASGKAKTPTPASGVSGRPANGSILQPSSTVAKAKIATPGAPRTTSTLQTANDEFQKWTKNALSKGLNAGINVDGFLTTLSDLPPEPEIISDSVYASSSTIDGRRFAEEYIRRRKLADRGVISDASTSNTFSSNVGTETKNGGGGWSEVAKKGGAAGGGNSVAEKDVPGFKVVSGKKKGGKR